MTSKQDTKSIISFFWMIHHKANNCKDEAKPAPASEETKHSLFEHLLFICCREGDNIVVLVLGKWKALHGPLKFLNESKYLSA